MYFIYIKGGFGIGLILVSKFVVLYYGEVFVMSEGVDWGSIFEVRLFIFKIVYE